MTVSYTKFLKHAEKVTKSVDGLRRPVFKGVYHKDGCAYVTDGYRLYKAKCAYSVPDGSLIGLPEGREIDAEYVDAESVFPDSNGLVIADIDVTHATNVIKAVQRVGMVAAYPGGKRTLGRKVLLDIEVKGTRIRFSTRDTGYRAASYTTEAQIGHPELYIAVNAQYLVDALDMFRDMGVKRACLQFYGVDKVITLANEEQTLQAVVLPVIV